MIGARAVGGSVGEAPDTGARRQFLLNLAVARERDAIAALAEHDPDSLVRATACQYLCRLVEPTDGEVYDLLVRQAGPGAAEPVVEAIAANLRPDAPPEIRRRLGGGFRGTRASSEADLERRLAESASAAAFLQGVRRESSRRIRFALALVRERGMPLSWSEVPGSLVGKELPIATTSHTPGRSTNRGAGSC